MYSEDHEPHGQPLTGIVLTRNVRVDRTTQFIDFGWRSTSLSRGIQVLLATELFTRELASIYCIQINDVLGNLMVHLLEDAMFIL